MKSTVWSKSFLGLTVTQFLGAFNDGAYRWFIVLLAIDIGKEGEISWLKGDPQPLVMAVFLVPFILFALTAGSLADRCSKRTIVVLMKYGELVVMALATLALAIHAIDPTLLQWSILASLVVLFLMGTQSAFFSPSKYGIIPELVADEDLSRANGLINLTTQAGILLGLMTGGFLHTLVVGSEFLEPYHSGLLFVTIAAIGIGTSYLVRKTPAQEPDRKIDWNLFTHTIREARFLFRDKELGLVVLGISWFWLVATLVSQVLNAYGEYALGDVVNKGTYLLFPLLIGIGIGSVLASKISGDRVKLGLVPVGVIGMGLGFIALYFLEPTLWTARIALAISGLFGGLLTVPLAAYSQQRPAATDKGRVMGFLELSNFTFMALSAAVYLLFLNVFEHDGHPDPQPMMLVTGIITISGLGFILILAPSHAIRFFFYLLTHSFYRLRVLHRENLPTNGGALIVSNHVSYADPFLIGIASPRYVRYLMHREFFEKRLMSRFAGLVKAIPIADTDSPRELLRSLKEAGQHAADGHLVCIFAEGGITRTGNLLPFSKGLERIAKAAKVPIVPAYIDRMWGSIFSYKGGKFFLKWPKIPYHVTVAFGKPLAPDSSTSKVRNAVLELGAEAYEERKDDGETLASQFLRTARRYPRRLATADATGKELTYRELLIAVLLVRKHLRRRLRDQTHVGILLPSSIGGTIANFAIASLGKIAVNLNFTAGKEALESAIEACNLQTIITSPKFLEKIDFPDDPRHLHLEDVTTQITVGQKLRAAAMSYLPGFVLSRLPGVPHNPDDIAAVIFSSGSTGVPKGICLSNHNILSNGRSFSQIFNVTAKDRMIGILPPFHSFGYTATMWFPLLNGIAVIYHPNPVDAKVIGELIEKYQATILFSTPTFYASYLRRFNPDGVKSLRIAASGAEKLKPALSRMWRERFGLPIFEGYGCTELSPAVSLNLPDIERPGVSQRGYKEGTIGHPLPGVAAKIVNPDTHEELEEGKEGLLLIKGPNVMVGYLDQPELTKEVIRDGWYATGDIAQIDSDGFITITDRLSRFSKIGGEMVPHVKIESEVLDVMLQAQSCTVDAELAGECAEVAVTSVPDEKKGEKLVVLHTPVPIKTEEVIAALRDTEMPKLWIPKQDCFFEVESIPKLGSGKLDLKEVKKQATSFVMKVGQ